MISSVTKPTIAVVIITYNRFKLFTDCIEAIRKQTHYYSRIFAINNGSTDGTKEWLDAQDDIETLHQANVGSSGGFYSGVKYAFEKGYDYIWVMDDDVLVTETALQELMNATAITKDFSFVCSKVVSKDGVFINAPNIENKLSQYHYPVWGQYVEHSIIQVKSSTFVSVLVNGAYLKQAGFPIKDFFIWGDDIDFTSRLTKAAPGYLSGKSIAVHLRVDPSFPSILTEKDERRIAMHFYNVRNNLYISRKHKRKSELFMDILHYLKIAFQSLFVANGFKKMWIYLKGFWAGLFFNPPIVYPNEKK